jgi:predicted small integral membrane protein
MIVLLFFGGFIDVGGEWFQMWRSTTWTGLDTAFRNAVFAIATLILIQLPSSSPTVQGAQGISGAQTKRDSS